MAVKFQAVKVPGKAATALNAGSRIPATALSSNVQMQLVPMTSIKLWADNPRKNSKGIPKLMDSLKAHGQKKPIVVWRKNMTIYAGNTTYKAAKQLGWKEIYAVLVDFPSEQAAVAYGIADNKTSEYSQWDETILTSLIRSDEVFFTKSNTGMTDRELSGLKLDIDKKIGGTAKELEALSYGQYMIIQFEDPEECKEFKELVGIGIDERSIIFSKLKNFLTAF